MRFLIVSAVLACASAAPSHLLTPVTYTGLPAVQAVPALTPVAYSAAVPTISPGDVQAAAIDAQVKLNDLAIAEADRARALVEEKSETLTEKVVTSNDQVKENNEESFWSAQDKQWQALDALKTAEALIDGAVASSAPALAKGVLSSPTIPAVPQIAPYVYVSGYVAPAVKALPTETKAEEPKPEEKKEEEKPAETKSAEPAQVEKESVTVEAKANLEAKSQLAPVVAPVAIPYSYPFVAPVAPFAPVASINAPVLKYFAVPEVGYAPTIVKSVW